MPSVIDAKLLPKGWVKPGERWPGQKDGLPEPGGGRVDAPVVDDDDFVVDPPVESRTNVGEERTDVVGLIAGGNHDRNLGNPRERRARRTRRAVPLLRSFAPKHGPRQ